MKMESRPGSQQSEQEPLLPEGPVEKIGKALTLGMSMGNQIN